MSTRPMASFPLSAGKLGVAEACLWRAQDFSGVMLLYAAQGNRQGLAALATRATEGGKHNVAFLASFLLGRLEDCVELLVSSNRQALRPAAVLIYRLSFVVIHTYQDWCILI